MKEEMMMIKKRSLLQFVLSGFWIFLSGMTAVLAQSVNTPAPLFSGTTLDGKVIQLSDYKGKVILLDIWASWCVPCKQEMPFLLEIDSLYRDQGLAVVTVNIDKDSKNVQKFIAGLESQPLFPVILDKFAKIPALYHIRAMPSTLLIDQNGVIRYLHVGFKDEMRNKYLEEIKILLKELQKSNQT